MQFRRGESIYQQISEYIYAQVLKGEWTAESRVPSVRELAVELEVNPNTVLRSYNILQEEGVIYNRRGIGYFVAQEGREAARRGKLEELYEEELPELFDRLELLGVTAAELAEAYTSHQKKAEEKQ